MHFFLALKGLRVFLFELLHYVAISSISVMLGCFPDFSNNQAWEKVFYSRKQHGAGSGIGTNNLFVTNLAGFQLRSLLLSLIETCCKSILSFASVLAQKNCRMLHVDKQLISNEIHVHVFYPSIPQMNSEPGHVTC